MSKFVGLRHLTSIVRASFQIFDSCHGSEQEKTPGVGYQEDRRSSRRFQFGCGVTQLDIAFITFQISCSLGPFWF